MTATIRLIQQFCQTHLKLLIVLSSTAALAVILLVTVCNKVVGSNARYILTPGDGKHVPVGIVLGSGITPDGKPFRELQARLDIAAQALNKGQVDKLILSGDNRFAQYNEPGVMQDYLINTKHIPAGKLQPDYAGRSTYESCERASKVFNLKQTIIFSAGSHLPRAIYLCRYFGIETYGLSSDVEANNSGRREPLARVKAVFNTHIKGENTILGAPINF